MEWHCIYIWDLTVLALSLQYTHEIFNRDAGEERGRRRGQGGGRMLEVGIMLKSSYNIAHSKMFPS